MMNYSFNRIGMYIEFLSKKAMFFIECFRKYPKQANKQGLRVSQVVDSLEFSGKEAENQRQSTAIVKLFPKKNNRGVWLLLVSGFTLNKYPCEISF